MPGSSRNSQLFAAMISPNNLEWERAVRFAEEANKMVSSASGSLLSVKDGVARGDPSASSTRKAVP